jgi:hypothetical protein
MTDDCWLLNTANYSWRSFEARKKSSSIIKLVIRSPIQLWFAGTETLQSIQSVYRPYSWDHCDFIHICLILNILWMNLLLGNRNEQDREECIINLTICQNLKTMLVTWHICRAQNMQAAWEYRALFKIFHQGMMQKSLCQVINEKFFYSPRKSIIFVNQVYRWISFLRKYGFGRISQ